MVEAVWLSQAVMSRGASAEEDAPVRYGVLKDLLLSLKKKTVKKINGLQKIKKNKKATQATR